MATALHMPDMGTVEGDVTVVRWLKSEGDAVALGEPLFEAETDKGVSEVESALAGEIVRLVVAEGARVGAGEVIAYIRQPGEPDEAVVAEPHAPLLAPSEDLKTGRAGETAGRIPRKVSPTIRKLAEKWGVDLSAVAASGPGGMVTREDVLGARDAAGTRRSSKGLEQAAVPAGILDAFALSRHQAGVARLVEKSHREKPTFRVNAAVDMTEAVGFREKCRQSGAAVQYDAIFVNAVAKAIAEHPVFRSWVKGEKVARHPDVAVAFAVSIGDELYAPAVKAADQKGVEETSREMDALARNAEDHLLLPADTEGSCFLVSNLGMFPVLSFDAIIYPEHSAALAVGATTPIPVADGQGVRVAPLATVTLTVDHRLINGRRAAQFLSRLKEILETGAI